MKLCCGRIARRRTRSPVRFLSGRGPVGYALTAVEDAAQAWPQGNASKGIRASIPPYQKLLWPTLEALKAIGGSATVQEIYEKVVEMEHFTEDQQKVTDGRRPTIAYRLAWARSYLKLVGALDNSRRGVWSINDTGRSLTQTDMAGIPAQVRAQRPKRKKASHSTESLRGGPEEEEEDGEEVDWKTQLVEIVQALPADAFERLCQRLLREAGFISVRVTGRPGDGGIDGMGVYQMALVSFPVFFQAKRYKGSVGASAVRDFRGAMSGRGDKGLLITTGTFTVEAQREATREGAPPVDLIDGDRLCDLLKEHSLGVAVETRTIEEVAVKQPFFENI
jgi:restriction system protein